MRVNRGPRFEAFEGFVTDCAGDLDTVPVDLTGSLSSDSNEVIIQVPRDIFVARTGVNDVPPGLVLSVTLGVDVDAKILTYGSSVATPRLFRGFIPLEALKQPGDSTNV